MLREFFQISQKIFRLTSLKLYRPNENSILNFLQNFVSFKNRAEISEQVTFFLLRNRFLWYSIN